MQKAIIDKIVLINLFKQLITWLQKAYLHQIII